jgi:hypothetical protein
MVGGVGWWASEWGAATVGCDLRLGGPGEVSNEHAEADTLPTLCSPVLEAAGAVNAAATAAAWK